jgi:mannosyl-oligosaccharide alpha-1,2-mannosidase
MEAVRKAGAQLTEATALDGLLPMFINPVSGKFGASGRVTLGARGDSYYEYLLKQWILTGRTEDHFLREYRRAVNGIRKHLVRTSGAFTFVGEILENNAFSAKMDHLVCFLPGTLALGHSLGADPSQHEHLELAEALLDTCVHGYAMTPTGLAPEIWWFDDATGPRIKPNDAFSLLRPETVESLFYMWRITRKPKFREAGWTIYQAFERHARVDSGGFAAVQDVMAIPAQHRNKMESFWLGETLKYLFLLFDDQDLFPFDTFVFNTEAHPLPIWTEHMQASSS